MKSIRGATKSSERRGGGGRTTPARPYVWLDAGCSVDAGGGGGGGEGGAFGCSFCGGFAERRARSTRRAPSPTDRARGVAPRLFSPDWAPPGSGAHTSPLARAGAGGGG